MHSSVCPSVSRRLRRGWKPSSLRVLDTFGYQAIGAGTARTMYGWVAIGRTRDRATAMCPSAGPGPDRHGASTQVTGHGNQHSSRAPKRAGYGSARPHPAFVFVLRNTAVAIRIRMDEVVGEQVVAFGVGARDVALASRELREWRRWRVLTRSRLSGMHGQRTVGGRIR